MKSTALASTLVNTQAEADGPALTRFVGVDDLVQLVRRVGLAACIEGVEQQIHSAFMRWQDFDKSARLACHSTLGVIELMPVADAQQFAFKYVNGHPQNQALGLPTVMAFGVLADVATGAPRLLSEMTLVTAIRTAAMSALAARHLARPGSQRMALIGNGAQAEFQALAFRDRVGVRELRLFDVDPQACARLAAQLQGQGLQLRLCASVAEAVQGADIVTTATACKQHAAVLTPEMIEPGMHINAIGGDCPGKTELHPDVLRVARVFVEFAPQTRIEGEIQQLPADFPVTEFWQVLRGQQPGRRDAAQVTVFDSVGFALEDFAALCFVDQQVRRLGLGQPLALLPQLADPKNLYALVADAPLAGQAALQPRQRRARARLQPGPARPSRRI